jgi:lipopolysaccharide transport system permease protein
MMEYLRDIYASRYFWLHLAGAEVRARFRRSRLGILWALLQPLLLTLLIASLFGQIFGLSVPGYALFVFSGLLVWEFLSGSVVSGCSSLLSAAPYIHQQRQPLAIYPLRNVLARLVVFLAGMAGFAGWAIIMEPKNLGLSWLSLVISLPALLLLAWPLAIIAALINTKFRDFEQFIGLVLQTVWYISPVFLEPGLFRAAKLGALLEYNPVTHVLNLVREPMLHGVFPSGVDWLYVAGTLIVLWLIAIWRIRREESRIVFYI